MNVQTCHGLLSPFRVRGFLFQWPADLLTNIGIEMEMLMLGWYILTETKSVLSLTVFGALRYLGTLIAPAFGMAGDKYGHRRLLCVMRACYTVAAAVMTALTFAGYLGPVPIFIAAAVALTAMGGKDLAHRRAAGVGEASFIREVGQGLQYARQTPCIHAGIVLVLAGIAQNFCPLPLYAMLLRVAGPQYRGRVMGVRSLAVYGLPVGLLAAGWLIERVGFTPMAVYSCVFGFLGTLAIALWWRRALWPLDAIANARP